MTSTAPTVFPLSPILDRDGQVVADAQGVPLAADNGGIVYTLQDDGTPAVLGALAETMDGQLVIADVRGLGDLEPKAKGKQLIRLGRQRAHARAKVQAWERRLATARQENLADAHPRVQLALKRIEHWRARYAAIQGQLDKVNSEAITPLPLSDDDGANLEGVDEPGADVSGLGSFSSFWKKNAKLIGGIAAGAAGAGLIGAAATPGTGANGLFNTAVKGVKGFFSKGAPAADGAAPGAASAAPPGADSAAATAAAAAGRAAGAAATIEASGSPGRRGAMPVDVDAGDQPRVAQAGLGGMNMKTMLIVAGVGLGALMLLKGRKD